MPEAATYKLQSGKLIRLGKPLGTGGEGNVYEVDGINDLVAKIYHAAPNPQQVGKLTTMIRSATPELTAVTTWPTDLVLRNNAVAGFLMPKLGQDCHAIVELYSPSYRRNRFPKADFAYLVHAAMNCAAVFENIHAARNVIGDVNQKNVVVDGRAMVRLIDCDSFQIAEQGKVYPCLVGVGEYKAPELHGRAFSSVTRTPNHDNFGLAVLIFQLLFMGRHPFAGQFIGTGNPPALEQAVQDFRFAYADDAPRLKHMKPPPNALPLSFVGSQMKRLFETAFMDSSVADGARPSAAHWRTCLESLKKSLFQCTTNSAHKCPSHLRDCPWCDLERHKIFYFVGALLSRLGGGNARALNTDLVSETRKAMDALKRAFGTTLPAPVAMRVSLPAHIAHSKALHASVSRCLLLALCLTWLGLLGSAAWGVDLLLFSWWLLLRGGVCGYRLEIKQTQQKLISMRATWSKAASELVDIRRRLESSVQKQLDSAEKALKHYEALPPKLNAKLNLLEKDRERYQQEEFLQRYPIEHCTANSIGPQRKATLRSFGIETAWDIESTRILAISGFGQTYTDELLAWRSKLLAKFRFDPNKAVSPREREQLIAHHNQVMLESERHLESALANVKALANQVESEQFRAVEHANRIAPDFAEAQGQLTALQAL